MDARRTGSGSSKLLQVRQAAAATQLSTQVSFLPFAASAAHQPEHRTTWRCGTLLHGTVVAASYCHYAATA
jgi:hypothetical protein